MRFESAAAKIPGSDEWWMARLSKKIGDDLRTVSLLDDWMDGKPPLPYPDKLTPAFHRLQQLARLNLAELIVAAMLHRMQPLACRTSVDQDSDGDDVVRDVWENSSAQDAFAQAMEWMLVARRGALMVGRSDPSDPDSPVRITAEHPSQYAWEPDPANPGLALAALKIYRDDPNDRDVAVLYRPDRIRVAYHQGPTMLPKRNAPAWRIMPTVWELEDEAYENTLGEVPVYEMENRRGLGEFERHLPTLERINHTVLQRMVLIAMQAFRQRALKGAPRHDKDGKEIDYDEIFEADPGSMWVLPAAVDMWESGQADFTPVLSSIKDDMIALAAASMTPLHMIHPAASEGSAEGAATQREAVIFKIESTSRRADTAIRRATSAALRLSGHAERAGVEKLKIVWANPRRSSLTERAESARGAKEAGVPFELRMEKFAELTPAEVAEAKRQRKTELLEQAVLAPTMTAAASSAGGTDE